LGSTAVGIQVNEGVVLAVEKRITSPLLVPSSIRKIVEIDSHIGAAMSGLVADARTLVDHARAECQNHWFTYDEKLRVLSTAQAVCDLSLAFGEGKKQMMSRPFGVALLIAGVDQHGPQLYHTDPSGTYTQYKAKAIGAGSEGAQHTLVEEYSEVMTLKEASTLALSILKQVMEDKINSVNVEVAVVPVSTGKYSLLTKEELEVIINGLPSGPQ
jgi:20S proteasome subunit alpha 5